MSFDNMPMQGYQGWNVNAPYMTPSYMANFRPSYGQGDQNNPYVQNHSIGQSAWALGPGDLGYGADTLGTLGAHRYNIATSPFDAGMQGLQSVAVPLASWYAADRVLGRTGIGAAMGRGMGNGAASAAGWGARRMGMGSIAGGAGRMGLGALAGGVGSLAGGMLMPIMAGQALSTAVSSGFIDPYVSTRRGMDAMRANNYSTALSGGGGSASGGFGMSATRAQAISQALTEAGQADFSLSGGDYNQIADNMMQAGMFQEVGDMDTTRIVDGVKKATSVLKMISRITGDNDIQEGIKTLAMLKNGGLDNIDQMGQAMQQIRNASAMSGTSVNQILDTVGSQGMVMAQQAGMRGVTGLLASADAYAGFTNARRSGLISGAQMQALGGAEGMTQNLMGGVMQMMQSPYARMTMQGGSSFGGSISGNVAKWGQGASLDPISSQGDWFLNKGAYTDAAMNQNGGASMTLSTLQAMAKASGLDPNNGRHIAAMAQESGMSSEQFRSIVEYDRSQGDLGTRMSGGQKRLIGQRSDFASEMQQEGLGMIGMAGVGDVQLGWRRFKSGVAEGAAKATSGITETAASISDWWEEMDANMKGTRLDHQIENYIVDGEGQGALFKLEGRSMMTAPGRDRNGKRVSKLSLLADDSQNATIASLNRAYLTADGDDKAKIGQIYQAIAKGDHEKAARLYSEIDEKSNGALSGRSDKVERQMASQEFEQKVKTRQIQASKRSTGVDMLSSAGGTLSEGAFMDAIGIGESGAAGYDAKVGGNRFSKGFNPSTSTVAQVLEQQKLSRSQEGNSAVGKFQFIYPTLKELTDAAISDGRLDPEQKFDKGVQDMLAKDLAMRNPDIAAYVNSPNPTAAQEEKAMDALAGIWASFPMADGKSKYRGVGNNRAHITRDQSRAAAKDLRSQSRAPAKTPTTSTGRVKDDIDLLNRLSAKTSLSKMQVSEFISTMDPGSLLKLINDGDNTEANLEKYAKKAEKSVEASKSAVADPSSINWDGVVDLKDGISKLGSATDDNTEAVRKLTDTLNKPTKGGKTLLDTLLEAVG
ncbi:hypothetical protein VPHD148_0004 [Vibrio phage D148]